MLKYVERNRDVFLKLYEDVLNGNVCKPRGQEIRECTDYKFTIDPRYPFTSFLARDLKLSYLAAELMWYLKGDRYDLSICDHGSMWKTLIQRDGGLNSNYGQTIFSQDNQFGWVCEELIRDPDSRRAVMIIGEKDYLDVNINDHRCCQYIQFLIRDNNLDCYVYFRSNDVSWGVSNDVFTIVEIYKYVYLTITQYLPNLSLGMYHHTATSMHVYERHYEMLKRILNEGKKGFYEVPFLMATSPAEYLWLANREVDSRWPPPHYKYSHRILEMSNE